LTVAGTRILMKRSAVAHLPVTCLRRARLNEVGSGPSDSSSLLALTPSTPTRARR
jgi:hypothetical protein